MPKLKNMVQIPPDKIGGFKDRLDAALQNEGFNRSFKVKSGRAEDAFYVLTPHMMECIQDLKQRFSNIAIHYTPSKIYVAYKTDENAYDIDTDMSVDLKREEAASRRDMQVIIDIINALKIDEGMQRI